MGELEVKQVNPALKDLVGEASRSLAQLDACRLEELAISCQILNRELIKESTGPRQESAGTRQSDTDSPQTKDGSPQTNSDLRAELSIQAREAVADLAVFARVLEATRANLQVMSRLRDLRQGRREYGIDPAQGTLPQSKWFNAPAGGNHGDN